jgi:uncharacterized protein (DUF2141 family)
MKSFASLLLVAAFFMLTSSSRSAEKTYSITVKVTNVRNNKGTMQFQVYRTQKAFAAETPYRIFRVSKKNKVSNKTMTYTITGLKEGLYGVALLDDENSNKKMDYSWMMPTEGFGFSDYYHTAWSKPTFYKFKFYLNKDKHVTMKVRYV